MNKIKILPPNEAQKIAAGEVVERPGNVIKELIENALDADASTITMHLEKAGKKCIRIIDDGCGMSPQDAKMCIQPHATSKITALADLDTISTFGFRGEALASVAAISKLTIRTKRQQKDENGIEISFVEGAVTSQKAIAHTGGTELCIQDLFYNTPVRKKFLKSDETEWHHLQGLIHAFCLCNTSVHFKLFKDGKPILNAPAVPTIKDRMAQIWGHNIAENFIPLISEEAHKNSLGIRGVISHHQFWRYNKQMIFFFVNDRLVKNFALSKALLKGYQGVLPPDRFPAACIFLSSNPQTLDINVHPRKEEVRFSKPLVVQQAIERIVKQSLENEVTKKLHETKSPEKQLEPGEVQHFDFGRAPFVETKSTYTEPVPQKDLPEPSHSTDTSRTFSPTSPTKHIPHIPSSIQSSSSTSARTTPLFTVPQKSEDEIDHQTIIGQLLHTYILLEHRDGLIIVDQHAAHERILYEKFRKRFENLEGTRLLFPEVMTLSPHHCNLLLAERTFFCHHGIEIDQFGENKITIKTAPPTLQNTAIRELIKEAIAFVEEHQHLESGVFRKKLHEHMHSQMACKTAIKAGDTLSQKAMEQLIEDLQHTDNRYICAHGRPTIWHLKKSDIEKNFKRRI